VSILSYLLTVENPLYNLEALAERLNTHRRTEPKLNQGNLFTVVGALTFPRDRVPQTHAGKFEFVRSGEWVGFYYCDAHSQHYECFRTKDDWKARDGYLHITAEDGREYALKPRVPSEQTYTRREERAA
jgi:hypothetical protein